VNIRRLGPSDEGVVRELADREPQAELLSDERTFFLAAFDDSTPIGFVLAYELPRRHGDPAHLFVYEIGVREDLRRKGVGTALMQRLADLARERGLRDAFLLTNESNTGAMTFYEAIGGVRPNADDVLWDLRFG
jgi:ribosomal protein S18 acetylase RimI-like enzyme